MKKIVSTLIFCLACLGGLEAQHYWKPIGMQGIFLGVSPDGSIYSYYGGSGNGPCFTRSQDEGETWQVVLGYETGFNCNFNWNCFSFSPEGRIFLFEGYPYRAFYSDDNGDTWQLTSGAAPLVAGDEAQQICAVNNETLVGVTSNYVFWTTDGGASWDTIRPAFIEDDKYIGDLLANGNGDVYFCLNHDSGGDSGQNIGVYHATLSDMDNWELVAFEGVSINDIEFDPEGNVVCNALVSDNFDGFEHVPGFYAFGSYNTFGIADNGIVYKNNVTENNTAVLAYSMDHGETFTELGEELELEPPIPGGSDGYLSKGYDNHLYFEGRGLYWKSIFSANIIPNKFAPQGAEWYFNVSSFMGSPFSYYHMEVLGDTIIQGHTCSVITQQFLGGNGQEQYVYEDNGKVCWYNQTLGRFTTLYDFDAEVGESWICEIDSCAYEVTVTEITYYEGLDQNHQFRAQRVSYNGELGYFGGGTIIDGIGEISGLFPYPYACVGDIYDGQYPDWLRCYLVDGEMLYHEGDLECDAVLPWQYPCWDGTVAESYDGGNGTAEDPYQIATPQQLALLAQQTNDGTGGDAYYLLTDDICLNANLEMWYHQWIPIGRVTDSTVAYFRGHFDGNGKTISKLLIETNELMTDSVIGLFGCTDGAEIVNVNLSGCRLTGGEYAGSLVGYAGSTDISNCSVQSSQITTSGGVAGGIVGYAGMPFRVHETNENISKITNCRIDLVTVESVVDAGGIVGKINDDAYYARYLVSNCVTYNEQYYHIKGGVAGGVVGEMRFGMIEGCSSRSLVDGAGQVINVCAGGIAGSIHGSSVIANSYNRYDVVANFGVAGGIVGYSAGDIYNVYNVGEIHLPDSTSSGFGTIVGNVQAGERLNCYWIENVLPAAGNPILPDMPGSTSFHRDSTATCWVLAEPQYGTMDLVEALNAGASEIESLYPEMRPVSRWKYSDVPIDFGLPVLVPNDSEDDELEAYCEAPMNFGGSPISDQGTYGAQLWWNKPFASHWFHYDEKPYAGSVYRNSWGIKIPAEEIQRGDLLTHVAFYRAGGQDQPMEYRFAFGFEGETEPDSWDYLPGNSVQVEPGPDGWVMAKLGSPIECEEGKCLWIVLEAPNVMGNPAAYCQASGNPNACWSSGGSVPGDWMIRGYFTNDVGYNEAGYNEELDHYNIYRGSSLEELEKIAEVGRDEEEYFDTLPQPFGDYYYQLAASYTDGRESVPARRGENPHDPDYVYFHVGNISSLGSEWYYEILGENGNVTYQHLEYASDTTVNNKDVKIIIRTNTLYDKGEHAEVTREYIYEDFGKVYWWNESMQDFTMLYNLGAQIGDEWAIRVGEQSITMHVDTVEQYEYEGQTYRMLTVSDADDLYSGRIVSGIGHLTSFFPEKLMTRGKDYRVEGIRCYWRNGELVFKYGDRDCDEVYEEWHNGIEEDGPSTGSGAFTVYPNPTNGVLIVETQNLASHQTPTYRITNLMGQTLMSGTITAEIQRIDVTSLPQGMYFISVGDATRKFVVQ